jgi:ATP-dependent protease HslVU (ClpYQ) ATPase subunit
VSRLPAARRVWGPDCVRLDMEEEAAEYLIDLLRSEWHRTDDLGARDLATALERAMSEDAL